MYVLEHGDVMDMCSLLPDEYFDACLCDPPYGLAFMGKKWDHGVPNGEVWRGIARVLKPGAPLLAFGGTRTHHRLMCAIEDAGFEIRDCLMWLYGSGFPKSLDISKALDKRAGAEREPIGVRRDAYGDADTSETGDGRNLWGKPSTKTVTLASPVAVTPEAALWSGYGTALKPAWEPIVLAMKPCDGTFAENALKWGVAGLNVDGGKIESGPSRGGSASGATALGQGSGWNKHGNRATGIDRSMSAGRWPANVLLDEESAAMLDRQTGTTSTTGNRTSRSKNAEVEGTTWGTCNHRSKEYPGDSGGASRFFYCAKPSRKERGEGNDHPTVKPISLANYLATIIKPPTDECSLLVPFCGSGSEIIGALQAGWDYCFGIDNDEHYLSIAEKRIERAMGEGKCGKR